MKRLAITEANIKKDCAVSVLHLFYFHPCVTVDYQLDELQNMTTLLVLKQGENKKRFSRGASFQGVMGNRFIK